MIFLKKGPDCIHLWAKFSIQNIGLSRRKNSKTFPCGAFYSWVFNELWKCPNSTKPFLPWTISSCPPLMIYRFAVQLISPTLNLWKLLFSLPNVCKKSCRTQKTYLYSLKGKCLDTEILSFEGFPYSRVQDRNSSSSDFTIYLNSRLKWVADKIVGLLSIC